jgi:hypothetical protein
MANRKKLVYIYVSRREEAKAADCREFALLQKAIPR